MYCCLFHLLLLVSCYLIGVNILDNIGNVTSINQYHHYAVTRICSSKTKAKNIWRLAVWVFVISEFVEFKECKEWCHEEMATLKYLILHILKTRHSTVYIQSFVRKENHKLREKGRRIHRLASVNASR